MPRVGLAHATMRRLRIAVGEPLLLISAAPSGAEPGFAGLAPAEGVLRDAAEVGHAGGCLTLAAAWPSAAAQASMALLDDATTASLTGVPAPDGCEPETALSADKVWVARTHALLPAAPTAHRVVLAVDENDDAAAVLLRDSTLGAGVGPATAISLATQLRGRCTPHTSAALGPRAPSRGHSLSSCNLPGRWVAPGARLAVSLGGRRMVLRVAALSLSAAAERDGGAGGSSSRDSSDGGTLAVVAAGALFSLVRDRGSDGGAPGAGAGGAIASEQDALERVRAAVGGVEAPAAALIQARRPPRARRWPPTANGHCAEAPDCSAGAGAAGGAGGAGGVRGRWDRGAQGRSALRAPGHRQDAPSSGCMRGPRSVRPPAPRRRSGCAPRPGDLRAGDVHSMPGHERGGRARRSGDAGGRRAAARWGAVRRLGAAGPVSPSSADKPLSRCGRGVSD
jgi:hypothetical protein